MEEKTSQEIAQMIVNRATNDPGRQNDYLISLHIDGFVTIDGKKYLVRPTHTTEKISSNKENGSTRPQEPSTNLEGIRSKLIVGEPQENWKKLADLPVLLEVDKWAAQGRTEEQIYGVTNFLTGLGGKNILALLSKMEQTTTPESQGDHESYKSQYLAFMEEFQTTGISRLELERIANYWFTLHMLGDD